MSFGYVEPSLPAMSRRSENRACQIDGEDVEVCQCSSFSGAALHPSGIIRGRWKGHAPHRARARRGLSPSWNEALLPGRRLFMLSTGTGLAPFFSPSCDPNVYDLQQKLVVIHLVRRVSDLAFFEKLKRN